MSPVPELSSSAWAALAVEVERLSALADAHQLGAELRWRLRALERAVVARSADHLSLPLRATDRATPPAAEAWSYDGITEADEIVEVAVWHLAVAGLELTEGAEHDVLRGPRAVIDALAGRATEMRRLGQAPKRRRHGSPRGVGDGPRSRCEIGLMDDAGQHRPPGASGRSVAPAQFE